MDPLPPTIREKIVAALDGNSDAFGTIFQWYRPRLYAHALRLCKSIPLAQDAVQETFISAFTHVRSLRSPDVLYPWMKKILVNYCLRSMSREKSVGSVIETKDTIIHLSIEDGLERVANNQWVYNSLNQLSDELNSCMLLRYFSKFNKYEQIASILDIPVGTVRSRLAAARIQLLHSCRNSFDASDEALKKAAKWSRYYLHSWETLYVDWKARNDFFLHFNPSLNIRFPGGKAGRGRDKLEKEVSDDIVYGTAFSIKDIATSGNISVIEGDNINSQQYPDRCPASQVFVLFRKDDTVETFHLHDTNSC